MNIMGKCFSVNLFSSSFSAVGKGSQYPSEQVEKHNKIWLQLLLCCSCVLSGAHLASVSVNGIFQKPFGRISLQIDCRQDNLASRQIAPDELLLSESAGWAAAESLALV